MLLDFFKKIFYFFFYNIVFPLIVFRYKFVRCHQHLSFIKLCIDVIL